MGKCYRKRPIAGQRISAIGHQLSPGIKFASLPPILAASTLVTLERTVHQPTFALLGLMLSLPATALTFRRALDDLAAQARRLSADGRFRFYRMRDLSAFLSRREQVRWQLLRLQDGRQGLHATLCCDGDTLAGMAWLLPRQSGQRPEVLQGQARIEADNRHWIVTATGGTHLQLHWRPV